MTMLLPGMPVTYGMPPAMGTVPMGGMGYGLPPAYGFPGPHPVSLSQHHLAQALGIAPPHVDQPSTMGSVLKGAGVGALAGAAFGAIPFLPLGLFSGALVGATIGAAVGLVKGRKAKADDVPRILTPEQQTAALQAQMIARR